jgi:hypothetical protein
MQGLSKLIAGDSLDFTTSVADYPATAGWTLKYRLIPRFTSPVQAPITLTATTYETSSYRVEAGPSETDGWAPGVYSWASWVEKVGSRVTIEQGGELTVAPDPGAATQGTDVRSSAQQALDAVTAMLSGKASSGVAAYRIAGRELRSYELTELIKLQSSLRADVQRERRAASIAAGLGNPSRFGVRLARV